VIYRQFSITIVSAMVLSVAVALIFTPALCATLLKAPKKDHAPRRGFFGWFNRNYDRMSGRYRRGVLGMIKHPVAAMGAFMVVVVLMVVLFLRIPGGFLPDEDQGVMFVQVTAPPGATSIRTQAVLNDVTAYLHTDPAVQHVFAVNGFSFGGRGQNAGIAFVTLKPWDQRPGAANRVQAVA
jgi:multidrug efflux pump